MFRKTEKMSGDESDFLGWKERLKRSPRKRMEDDLSETTVLMKNTAAKGRERGKSGDEGGVGVASSGSRTDTGTGGVKRTVLGEIPVLAPDGGVLRDMMPPDRYVLGGKDRNYRADYHDDEAEVDVFTSLSATSENRMSPRLRQPPLSARGKGGDQPGLGLTHVDSVLLTLSKSAIADSESDEDGILVTRKTPRRPLDVVSKSKSASRFKSRGGHHTGRFILGEARCRDDEEDEDSCSKSSDNDDEDDTDLSGFIVDDDAELSFHDDSESGSDRESHSKRGSIIFKSPVKPGGQRKLIRGSPSKRMVISDSDHESSDAGGSNKENEGASKFDETLGTAMRSLRLDERKVSGSGQNTGEVNTGEIEVIDLSSSPERPGSCLQPSKLNFATCVDKAQEREGKGDRLGPLSGRITLDSLSNASNPWDNFDAALRFLPPMIPSPTKIPVGTALLNGKVREEEMMIELPSKSGVANINKDPEDNGGEDAARPNTPPPPHPTLPRTPTKLKSPSKLSPSKNRVTIPQSPHRQSVDAFWDLNHVNEWNDTYSPRKAPLTSPRKALTRFRIWEDSDFELDGEQHSNENSPPSPCTSPRKRLGGDVGVETRSPMKSPTKTTAEEREEKKKIAAEKKAERERKKIFDAKKEKLAMSLLTDLDVAVAESKLASLSAGTGGVKILWSKTLRSTAGRANWRRTVTKQTGSPVKGNLAEGPDVKVQHYASIELAEKVIDSEERLVNTLAHEFCHLACFMISGVRDQPHGAEFKRWANKVTAYLRQDPDNEVRRGIKVTTKHEYAINHKYLWICVGREQTAAMTLLNLKSEEPGCGAEYGRHSKSIDVERQRCGKCRGRLLQVRPRPKAGGQSPTRKPPSSRGISNSGSGDIGVEKNVEVVHLDD